MPICSALRCSISTAEGLDSNARAIFWAGIQVGSLENRGRETVRGRDTVRGLRNVGQNKEEFSLLTCFLWRLQICFGV